MSDETRPSNRPATFSEVFGQREYRAVFAASALSWLGDYISKAAVTVIVYQESQSVALSAAAFAISYLPWLVGGPLLATLAERYPYRNVMVVCDLARMALIALIVIPGVPVPLMLVILFVATLANPPSQAARSALMPLILPGDKLVVGLSLNNSTGQAAQVAGYALGAGIAAFNPRAAIVLDARHVPGLGTADLVRHRAPPAGDAGAPPVQPVPRDRRGFPPGLRPPGAARHRAAGLLRDALLDRPGGPGRRLGAGAGRRHRPRARTRP